MKTGIFSIAVLALLQVAIAQPHGKPVATITPFERN